MSDTDRIPCPHCQANNFPSSAVCWQCGQPLRAQSNETPGGPPPPVTPPTPGPVQPPPPSYEPPPTSRPPDNGQTLVILGFIFAALGIFCCPIFGPVAIIMGVIAKNRGNALGTWVIIAGVASTLIGVIFTSVGVLSFLKGMQGGGYGNFPNPRDYTPQR